MSGYNESMKNEGGDSLLNLNEDYDKIMGSGMEYEFNEHDLKEAEKHLEQFDNMDNLKNFSSSEYKDLLKETDVLNVSSNPLGESLNDLNYKNLLEEYGGPSELNSMYLNDKMNLDDPLLQYESDTKVDRKSKKKSMIPRFSKMSLLSDDFSLKGNLEGYDIDNISLKNPRESVMSVHNMKNSSIFNLSVSDENMKGSVSPDMSFFQNDKMNVSLSRTDHTFDSEIITPMPVKNGNEVKEKQYEIRVMQTEEEKRKSVNLMNKELDDLKDQLQLGDTNNLSLFEEYMNSDLVSRRSVQQKKSISGDLLEEDFDKSMNHASSLRNKEKHQSRESISRMNSDPKKGILKPRSSISPLKEISQEQTTNSRRKSVQFSHRSIAEFDGKEKCSPLHLTHFTRISSDSNKSELKRRSLEDKSSVMNESPVKILEEDGINECNLMNIESGIRTNNTLPVNDNDDNNFMKDPISPIDRLLRLSKDEYIKKASIDSLQFQTKRSMDNIESSRLSPIKGDILSDQFHLNSNKDIDQLLRDTDIDKEEVDISFEDVKDLHNNMEISEEILEETETKTEQKIDIDTKIDPLKEKNEQSNESILSKDPVMNKTDFISVPPSTVRKSVLGAKRRESKFVSSGFRNRENKNESSSLKEPEEARKEVGRASAAVVAPNNRFQANRLRFNSRNNPTNSSLDTNEKNQNLPESKNNNKMKFTNRRASLNVTMTGNGEGIGKPNQWRRNSTMVVDARRRSALEEKENSKGKTNIDIMNKSNVLPNTTTTTVTVTANATSESKDSKKNQMNRECKLKDIQVDENLSKKSEEKEENPLQNVIPENVDQEQAKMETEELLNRMNSNNDNTNELEMKEEEEEKKKETEMEPNIEIKRQESYEYEITEEEKQKNNMIPITYNDNNNNNNNQNNNSFNAQNMQKEFRDRNDSERNECSEHMQYDEFDRENQMNGMYEDRREEEEEEEEPNTDMQYYNKHENYQNDGFHKPNGYDEMNESNAYGGGYYGNEINNPELYNMNEPYMNHHMNYIDQSNPYMQNQNNEYHMEEVDDNREYGMMRNQEEEYLKAEDLEEDKEQIQHFEKYENYNVEENEGQPQMSAGNYEGEYKQEMNENIEHGEALYQPIEEEPTNEKEKAINHRYNEETEDSKLKQRKIKEKLSENLLKKKQETITLISSKIIRRCQINALKKIDGGGKSLKNSITLYENIRNMIFNFINKINNLNNISIQLDDAMLNYEVIYLNRSKTVKAIATLQKYNCKLEKIIKEKKILLEKQKKVLEKKNTKIELLTKELNELKSVYDNGNLIKQEISLIKNYKEKVEEMKKVERLKGISVKNINKYGINFELINCNYYNFMTLYDYSNVNEVFSKEENDKEHALLNGQMNYINSNNPMRPNLEYKENANEYPQGEGKAGIEASGNMKNGLFCIENSKGNSEEEVVNDKINYMLNTNLFSFRTDDHTRYEDINDLYNKEYKPKISNQKKKRKHFLKSQIFEEDLNSDWPYSITIDIIFSNTYQNVANEKAKAKAKPKQLAEIEAFNVSSPLKIKNVKHLIANKLHMNHNYAEAEENKKCLTLFRPYKLYVDAFKAFKDIKISTYYKYINDENIYYHIWNKSNDRDQYHIKISNLDTNNKNKKRKGNYLKVQDIERYSYYGHDNYLGAEWKLQLEIVKYKLIEVIHKRLQKFTSNERQPLNVGNNNNNNNNNESSVTSKPSKEALKYLVEETEYSFVLLNHILYQYKQLIKCFFYLSNTYFDYYQNMIVFKSIIVSNDINSHSFWLYIFIDLEKCVENASLIHGVLEVRVESVDEEDKHNEECKIRNDNMAKKIQQFIFSVKSKPLEISDRINSFNIVDIIYGVCMNENYNFNSYQNDILDNLTNLITCENFISEIVNEKIVVPVEIKNKITEFEKDQNVKIF